MITQERLCGGYVEVTHSSGDYLVTKAVPGVPNPIGPVILKITPTTSGLGAKLPAANDASLSKGGPHFIVWNASGSQNLTLKNGSGSTLNTIGPGDAFEICLISNTNVAGVWHRFQRTVEFP